MHKKSKKWWQKSFGQRQAEQFFKEQKSEFAEQQNQSEETFQNDSGSNNQSL